MVWMAPVHSTLTEALEFTRAVPSRGALFAAVSCCFDKEHINKNSNCLHRLCKTNDLLYEK